MTARNLLFQIKLASFFFLQLFLISCQLFLRKQSGKLVLFPEYFFEEGEAIHRLILCFGYLIMIPLILFFFLILNYSVLKLNKAAFLQCSPVQGSLFKRLLDLENLIILILLNWNRLRCRDSCLCWIRCSVFYCFLVGLKQVIYVLTGEDICRQQDYSLAS